MSLQKLSIAFATVLISASSLYAVPTQVVHQNAINADGSEHCDPLFIPTDVDEIGDPLVGFPPDEALFATATQIFQPVCFLTDNPGMIDAVVEITNLTGRDLTEVWYVASNETRISNYDGWANDIGFPIDFDNEAFRIDNPFSDPGGMHHPLISESILPNGIWEAGEIWAFILQDYDNFLGYPADALISIGVGDASLAIPGAIASSGSIIAIPRVMVPEPSTCLLMVFGLAGIVLRRQS